MRVNLCVQFVVAKSSHYCIPDVAKEINIQFRVSDLLLDRRESVDGDVVRWNWSGIEF